MAKKASFARPKPLYQDGGYTGILAFTILAMALGMALLVMEWQNDYGGNSEGTGIAQAPTVKSLIEAEKRTSTTPVIAPMNP